jgi:hypothetical protein
MLVSCAWSSNVQYVDRLNGHGASLFPGTGGHPKRERDHAISDAHGERFEFLRYSVQGAVEVHYRRTPTPHLTADWILQGRIVGAQPRDIG